MEQYYAIYSSIVKPDNNVVVSGVVDGQLDTGIILTQNDNLFIVEKFFLSEWSMAKFSR